MSGFIEIIEAKERYRVYEFSVIKNMESLHTNLKKHYERIFLEYYPKIFSNKNEEDENGMIDNLVDYEIKKIREVINYRDRDNFYLQVLVKEIYCKV